MLIRFKVDTGADVTAILLKDFQLAGVKLHPPNKVLHGPAKHPLKVSGQFTGALLLTSMRHKGKFLLKNYCSLPAIKSIVRASSTDDFVNLYPDLFNGLGSLSVEYQI